jgi:hypothetical protein
MSTQRSRLHAPNTLDRHEPAIDDDDRSARNVSTVDALGPHRKAVLGLSNFPRDSDRHGIVGRPEDADRGGELALADRSGTEGVGIGMVPGLVGALRRDHGIPIRCSGPAFGALPGNWSLDSMTACLVASVLR